MSIEVRSALSSGVNRRWKMYIKSALAFIWKEAADDEAKHPRPERNGKRWPQPDWPRCRVSSRVMCWRLERPYSYLAAVGSAELRGRLEDA